MARMAEAGVVERLLVDRVGDDGRSGAVENESRRPVDRLDRAGRVGGIGAAGASECGLTSGRMSRNRPSAPHSAGLPMVRT